MLRYYELLSDMSIAAVEQLKSDMKNGIVHPMEAKKRLGREMVASLSW